jgi:hypothetical protein
VCAGARGRELLARGPALASAALALSSGLLALVLWRQAAEVERLHGAYHWLDESALALACGVIDEQNALLLYSLAPKLAAGDAILRERELSIYAEPWWGAVGHPLAERFPRSAPSRAGELRTSPLATVDGGQGTLLQGWCSEREGAELAGPILVTDEAGLVVGLGRLRPSLSASRGWILWSGFARGARAPGELRAWALREDGAVAPLTEAGG